MSISAYDQPETAAIARVRNACWGLERVAEFLVHCAVGNTHGYDPRESVDHTVRQVVASLDELYAAREALRVEERTEADAAATSPSETHERRQPPTKL
jgi:hypothetical protein